MTKLDEDREKVLRTIRRVVEANFVESPAEMLSHPALIDRLIEENRVRPTAEDVKDWEHRLIDGAIKATWHGDAEKLAHLAQELLGAIRTMLAPKDQKDSRK